MNSQTLPSQPFLDGAKSILRHIKPRSLGALLILALACLFYRTLLLDSHHEQLANTEKQARLRAAQMSATLAMQVETLIHKLEHFTRSLADEYPDASDSQFARLANAVLTMFPPGSIARIAVADAQGGLVYVNQLSPTPRNLPTVNVADQEYFRVHTRRDAAELFISRPELDHVSDIHTIQFSYPIRTPKDGFAGAVVLSVSPNYISDHFRKVFTTDNDVAMLLSADGSYLARSTLQDEVMSKRAPIEREFLRGPQARSGEYRIPAPIDGVERYYAWHRVQHYPLIVSIGLDRKNVLAATLASIDDSLRRNLAGMCIILFSALWITLLFARLSRDRELLEESEKRHKLALEGGSLGSWDWEAGNDRVIFDQRWCAILGYAPEELAPTLDTIRHLVHPDDRNRLRVDFVAHVYGLTEVLETEYRIRHHDGHWVWISSRGRATERASNGKALRISGTYADISQQVAETLLRHALLNNTAAAIFLVTPERIILFSNQRAIDTFSVDGHPLDGQNMRVIHCNDSSYEAFHTYYSALRSGKATIDGTRTEYRLRTGRGESRWFNIHGTLLDPDQPDGNLIWTLIDITERRRTEEALSAARGRLAQIIEHFPGGILVEDEQGRVIVANRALCDLFACSPMPANALIGQDHASLRHQFPREVLDVVLSNDSAGPRETLLSDGRSIRTTRIPIRHGAEDVDRLWIVHDITEQRRHEQKLERLASTDTLTGLANRRTFMMRLESELAHITRGGPGGMVAMLDLDHFKQVNDHYGHAAGDAVLIHLATLLLRFLRREDVAARLGGEEFAILLPGADPAGALMLSERIRTALKQSQIETIKGNIRITTSIGLAPLTGNIKALLARADAALYQAKNNGRNRVILAQDGDPPA